MCAAAAAIESLGLTKNRLEALADGVFATLMTVLVLTLALPPKTSDAATIAQRLVTQPIRDALFAYAMSFVVLGVFWIGHHNMFHYVRRTTRVFLWLNILFLLTVGLIPFSTTVFGADLFDRTAIIFYGVNLILGGTGLYLVWWYATRNKHLVDHDIDPHLVSSVKRRILTGPLLYVAGIVFAFVPTIGPIISIILYMGALVYFILPGHVDIHFTRKHHE